MKWYSAVWTMALSLVFMHAVRADDVRRETFPKTIPTSQDFKFDFKQLVGPGKFKLLKAPGGLKLSDDGVVTWYAGNGFRGTQQFEFELTRKGKTTTVHFKLIVASGRSRPVPGAKRRPRTGKRSTVPRRSKKTKTTNRATPRATPTPTTKANPKRDVRYEWFPTTIPVSQKFKYDLAELVGAGKFELEKGPGGFKISPQGIVDWYAGSGFQGIQKLIFRRTDKAGDRTFYIKLRVEHGKPRPIQSRLRPKDSSPNTTPIDGKHTILGLARPGGWVMSADDATLIVSLPDAAQLVYIDTVKEKEVRRVKVDFQPAALTLQGETLFASARGASLVYALDVNTGKVQREFVVGASAVAHLACHRTRGPVFASTGKFDVFALNSRTGKATKTTAKAYFLAVDPVKGEFLYTGLQPRDRDELVIKEEKDGTIRFIRDRWGRRAMLMKYSIRGSQLKLVSAQNNAAVNGWWMHLSPDGKRIMMVGGGGWRPKDDGVGGGYITAIFSTANLQARVGQIPSKLNAIMHPALNLGMINDYGKELIPFQSRSLTTQPAVMIKEDSAAERRASVFTFAARGTKVLLWNGENALKEQGLHFIPLALTGSDKARLAAAYSNNASTVPSKLRLWTDRTGRFSVKAEFVGLSTKGAKLQKANGQIIIVPLSSLSKKDLDYLNNR